MFWTYSKMVIKNTVLHINLLIGLSGGLIVYFSKINIPYSVFVVFPILALFYSGYEIYKNSAPSITIIPPDKDDIEVRRKLGFEIVMKSRITNFGNRSGSLEDIKLSYIGFNGLKDTFLLNNLMFSIDSPVILKKKPNMLYSLKQSEFTFNYPHIIQANTNDYLYFFTILYVNTGNEDKLKEALSWIKTLEFELEYKYKETTPKAHVKKSKIIIDTVDFLTVFETSKREELALEEAFKDM